MRKKRTILKFFILSVLMHATSAFGQTYEDWSSDSLTNWIDLRIKNINKNIQEIVEMPFVVRSLGWGCMCPDYYIGVSPNTQEGPWISVIAPDDFPVSDTKGYSLIVTGVFTGDSVEEDFRNEDGEPEEWLYKMPEFKIHNWKENRMDYDVPAPKVILNKSQPEGTKILGSWKLNDLYVNSEKRNIDTSQLIVWDFTPDRKLTSSITSSEEPMRWHTTKDSIFITDSEFPDEKIIGTWKVEEVLLTLDLVMNDKSKRRLIFRRKTGILETQ